MTTPAATPDPLSRLRHYLPETLILIAAAMTRFWRLDYHSFWFDEAVSLDWAEEAARLHLAEHLCAGQRTDTAGLLLAAPFLAKLAGIFRPHAQRCGTAGTRRAARRADGAGAAAAGAAAERAGNGAAGRAVGGAGAGAGLVQPGTAHVPAGDDGAGVGHVLSGPWQGERQWARLGWWLGMIGAFTFALYSYLFDRAAAPPRRRGLRSGTHIRWRNTKMEM